MSTFFQKVESSLKVFRAKENFSGNPGNDILDFFLEHLTFLKQYCSTSTSHHK